MARGAFVATRGVERLGRLALAAVVFVPVLIAGLLAWALATPTDDLERVTAAIVNDDEPVTVNGQSVPLGRQFAAGLVDGTSATDASSSAGASTATPAPTDADSPTPSPSPSPATGTPTPSPTDPDAATDGAPDFTWVLTNDGEAAAGLQSGRYVAVVTIPSSFSAAATSFSGPASAARQAVIEVETTPASAFLDPALTAAVTAAATAALNQQLIEQYLGNVYAGFNTISEQIGQAAAGAADLSSGTSSLADGAQSLASGASQLDSGLEALDSGADSLAAGLAQLDAGVQQLPGQTSQLAQGAAEVSAGVAAISGALDGATAELAGIVAEICRVPGSLCDRATAALTRLQDADTQLSALAAGAQQVASGNAELADAMPPLVGGMDASADGAAEVASGADQASEGGQSLADGAQSLADGAAQLDSGAAELSSGLDEATSQIPTYSDDDITTLSSVVSQPVLADQNSIAPGFLSAPLFTGLALWLGGLVLALARRAVPTRRLLTAASSSSIALRSALATVGIGAAQGLVVAITVLASVDLTSGQAVGFIGAAVFVGAVFALANQGLAAAFGGFGRLIALLIALVALTAGLSSTVPPVIAALAGSMPTAPGLSLLVAPLTGDASTGWASAGLLALIAVVSVALVFAGVGARRRVRSASLTA